MRIASPVPILWLRSCLLYVAVDINQQIRNNMRIVVQCLAWLRKIMKNVCDCRYYRLKDKQ